MPAFPSGIAPASVAVRPVYAVAQFDNPISLTTEVQSMGGFRFEVDITMQKMAPEDAAEFGAFIQAMAGGVGTFDLNLTPWAPGWTPAPGVRTFRLAMNNTGWNAALAREVAYQFTAIEDV